jgi:hypothetical protein
MPMPLRSHFLSIQGPRYNESAPKVFMSVPLTALNRINQNTEAPGIS